MNNQPNFHGKKMIRGYIKLARHLVYRFAPTSIFYFTGLMDDICNENH